MIQKKTWKQLIKTSNNFTNEIALFNLTTNTELASLVSSIDSLLGQKVGMTNLSNLSSVLSCIADNYLYARYDTGLWDDMTIWLSSFKEKDKRGFLSIYHRLVEYCGFYKKILTDDGLAKQITTNRSYADTGSSTQTSKDANSETPQIDMTDSEGNLDFNEAMKYASNLSSNEGHSDSNRYGSSQVSISSKSWDEQLQNTRLIFYNDLIDYISKIPELLYHFFCLETVPYPDIVKQTLYSIKQAFKLTIDNE